MNPSPSAPIPPAAPARAAAAAAAASQVRIWDLPTRVFHWALTAAVCALLATGLGGVMEWHFRLGYLTLALLLFRLVWGFVGGRWSRFAAFVYTPSAVWTQLRGQAHPDHLVGHTPLGALSVFALLGVLAAQVATGLVSDDEIAAAGPLTRFVSAATVGLASQWHASYGKWIVIGLVAIHVLAVLAHVVIWRHTLVRPMWSGDKNVAAGVVPSRDNAASRLAALALFVLCIGLAWWISTLRA